ncbi:hypothetical protein [Streptomyces sp. NPDC003863]
MPARPDSVEQPAARKKTEREAARLRDLERARTTAEEADAEAGRRERELRKAHDAQESAEAAREKAVERVRRLEHELQDARQAEAEAKAAETEGATAVMTAERALGEARRVAERAVRAVERLEQQGERRRPHRRGVGVVLCITNRERTRATT